MKHLIVIIVLTCTLSAQTVAGGKSTWGGKAVLGAAASGGSFGPSYITAGSCETGSSSCTITLSVTAGNFAVCVDHSTSVPTNTLTCTDASLDSFSYTSSYADTGNDIGIFGWATMSTTTSEVFTCHVSNNANSMDCAVMVFSGTPTSGFDVAIAGANNAGVTSITTGTTSTTSAAHELGLVMFGGTCGGACTGQALSSTGSWTCPTAAADVSVSGIYVAGCYQILTSTQTLTGTATAAVALTGLGAATSIK